MQQYSFNSLEQAVERNPIVVSPEISLEEVVRLMKQGWASSCQLPQSDRARTGLVASICQDYVLAIADSRLLGIFTESDLVHLISSGTSWKNMTLAEVMNKNVVTLQYQESQDILAALNLLIQHQIHHLPIVDRNHRLQGLITQNSLGKALQLTDLLKITTVREVMSRAIHAFTTVSVLEVAQLMTDYRVSCIPIVEVRESDELLRPVGIITKTDIVQFQLLELNLAQIQAQTVMSTPLFLARPEDSLWAVNQQLERNLIRHLVVVGEKGELLGVINQNNLCFAIAMWGTLTRSKGQFKPEEERIESLERRNIYLTNQIARQASELQKRSQREQLVATIALRIRQSLDLELILNTTVAEVRQLINADRVLIYRFEADDSGIITNESVSDSQWSILDLVVKDSCFERAWIESFQQGHISSHANIERSNLSQCYLKFLEGFQVKANIAIPILLRDEDVPLESLWGLLIVHQCSTPREWQKSELELLQLLATQIAIAIQQGELYQQAQNEITRRKQVEAEIRENESQLRTALDAAALGTWSWNMETNEVSLSERSQSFLGFNQGEFPGTLDAVLNRLHPQNPLKMEEKTFKAIAKRDACAIALRELYDLETRVLLPNGSSRWLSARGHVLPNLEGQPKQMVGVIADISEKKQLEEQFLRHQRLESLGCLASGIAHDLNNIFTPILMSVQLLPVTLAQIDPRSRELIQMVENNVKRGSTLVQQILSFARGIEGERGIVQVKHIIADIRQFAIEAFPKSLEIRTNVSPALWTIKGDAAQIYQILLNLAINAKDAMPDGGLLNISADNLLIDEQYVREHCQAQVGSYIVIAVSDTGSGIAEENRKRIFEPFFSTKKGTGGTGLGLATVKKIVQTHHGTIDVVSQIGQGTQFTIVLPAVRTSETELSEHSAIPKGREELILVADDEATIREITRASLVTHNYRVITASNGIEAIASYVQNQTEVALVIINMMMPAMDGTTAILTLQKIDPKIEIIAISGRNFSHQTFSDRNLNISSFLAKPYSTYTLLQTIKDVLTQHEPKN